MSAPIPSMQPFAANPGRTHIVQSSETLSVAHVKPCLERLFQRDGIKRPDPSCQQHVHTVKASIQTSASRWLRVRGSLVKNSRVGSLQVRGRGMKAPLSAHALVFHFWSALVESSQQRLYSICLACTSSKLGLQLTLQGFSMLVQQMRRPTDVLGPLMSP